MARPVMRMTVDGAREIQQAFRELPKRAASKVIRQAIRAGLKPMQAKVKQCSPRDTGALVAAVKIRARKKVKRGVIAMNVIAVEGDLRGQTSYLGFQEWGTKKDPGEHMFERGFDATENHVTLDVSRQITLGILREFGLLAKKSSGPKRGNP